MWRLTGTPVRDRAAGRGRRARHGRDPLEALLAWWGNLAVETDREVSHWRGG
ncbi:hypothetical protein [Saccharothrix xinjiangensis]|uniref:Uncharacterized protein n=1 Tax=Saccharothrix xinjiangensis TaxID=204798 RepID=A0ABV9XY06_9PSEU